MASGGGSMFRACIHHPCHGLFGEPSFLSCFLLLPCFDACLLSPGQVLPGEHHHPGGQAPVCGVEGGVRQRHLPCRQRRRRWRRRWTPPSSWWQRRRALLAVPYYHRGPHGVLCRPDARGCVAHTHSHTHTDTHTHTHSHTHMHLTHPYPCSACPAEMSPLCAPVRQ